MEKKHKQPITKTEGSTKSILKKSSTILKNFFCAIIWLFFIYRILNEPLPDFIYSLPGFQFVQNSIVNIIFYVLVSLVVFSTVFKKFTKLLKFSFFLWLRLVFFPVIALFYLVFLPYKLFRYLYQGFDKILNNFVRTTITKSAILLIILIPTSLIILTYASELYWLIIALSFVILSLMIILRTAFFWTAKPLIIFEESLTTYYRFIDWYLNIVNKNNSSSSTEKKSETLRGQIDLFQKSLDWMINFITKSTDQKMIVKVFFIVFSLCFAMTVIAFGILYLGLYKLDPNSFSSMSLFRWNIFDFIYSSLLVITTSGDIAANTYFAKMAVSFEILFGIGLLSLLIFQFSIISIPEVLQTRNDVLKRITEKKEFLEIYLIRSTDKSIDDLPSCHGRTVT